MRLRFIGMVILLYGQCPWAFSALSGDKFNEYLRNPNAHPQIPNCSYSGYGYGDLPLPNPKVTVNASEFGLRESAEDNSHALQAAIDEAENQGGGVVLIPHGEYHFMDVIRIKQSNIILRGEGKEHTLLHFSVPLAELYGSKSVQVKYGQVASQYSWMGGLVYVGPTVMDIFNDERWSLGKKVSNIRSLDQRGSFTITADNTEGIQAGRLYILRWVNPFDNSLYRYLSGQDQQMGEKLLKNIDFLWPVEIASVQGNKLELKQPLRLDIRSEWNVEVFELGSFISDVGVENLSIYMNRRTSMMHNQEVGFNGIYFNRVIHGFIKEVEIKDSDSAIIVSSSKNITASNLRIFGGWQHHALAVRNSSHEVLFSNFRVESRPIHGISVESFSTGNVWSNGVLLHGTFDSHRRLPIDNIRTQIQLYGEGKAGGDPNAGPPHGVHLVHWNIEAKRKFDISVFEPKNALVVGMNLQVWPKNLYEAELEARRATSRNVVWTTP